MAGFNLSPHNLLWNLICVCSLLSQWLTIGTVTAKERYVYWNISNPIFKLSGVNPFLVLKNDRLVFACPTNGLEFYQLYWTQSAAASEACQADSSQVFSLVECDTPGDSGAFWVTDFSPIPGAPTFDRTVYVFTTSTGDRAGIRQMTGGACSTRNMRLAIDIGDPDSVTSRTTTAGSPTRAQAPPSDKSTTTTSKSDGGGSSGGSGGGSGGGSSGGSGDGSSSGSGGGSGGGSDGGVSSEATSLQKPAQSTKQTLSPTPQDLANHVQLNLIIASATTLPSNVLITVSLATIALTLHCYHDLLFVRLNNTS